MLVSFKKQTFNYNISYFAQRKGIGKNSCVFHSQSLYWLRNCTLIFVPTHLAPDEIKILFIILFAVSVFTDTGEIEKAWPKKKKDVIKNRTMTIIKSLLGATINKRFALWHVSAPISVPMQSYRVSGAIRETWKIINLKVLLLHWSNPVSRILFASVPNLYSLPLIHVKKYFSIVIHFINFSHHRHGGMKARSLPRSE